MRILITGGGGFLGSSLISALLKQSRKNKILIFDSYTHGFPKKFSKRLEAPIIGRIQNYYDIYRTLDRFRPEIVIHLAAYNTRPESIGQLRTCAEVNYLGTANLLEGCLMLKERPKKLIFASSEAAAEPVRNFGISKRAAEDLILTTLLGVPGAGISPKILRFPEIYGHNTPYSSNSLVNFLVDNMIVGNDVALYGVDRLRDYVHISDAVRACELAVQHEDSFLRVDIGSGKRITVKTLANKIKKLTGYTGKLKLLDNDLVPVRNSVVNPKLAKLTLGFECSADFDTELESLVAQRKKDLK